MTGSAPRPRRHLSAAAWLLCVLVNCSSAAADVPTCEPEVLTLAEAATLLRVDPDEVDRLAAQGGLPARRIGSSWRFSCAALMDWLARTTPDPLRSPRLEETAGKGVGQDQASPPPAPAPTAEGQDRPVGEAPAERPAEDIFLRGQRVLLGPGGVVLDVGQFYARSDDYFLAAVDGAVGLATSQQHALTTLVVGRVGILRETELFVSTTFHRSSRRESLNTTTLASSRRSEFGGVQLGVRRTVVREAVGRPDVIVGVSASLPTGETPATAGLGVVLVKSIDPAVLFASANFVRSVTRQTSAATRAGHQWDLSVGYGLGLNDTLAISMAVSGVFTGGAGPDTQVAHSSDVFSARFGVTSWLGRGLYIEPSVSIALTGPADSFAFAVTMPFTF